MESIHPCSVSLFIVLFSAPVSSFFILKIVIKFKFVIFSFFILPSSSYTQVFHLYSFLLLQCYKSLSSTLYPIHFIFHTMFFGLKLLFVILYFLFSYFHPLFLSLIIYSSYLNLHGPFSWLIRCLSIQNVPSSVIIVILRRQ